MDQSQKVSLALLDFWNYYSTFVLLEEFSTLTIFCFLKEEQNNFSLFLFIKIRLNFMYLVIDLSVEAGLLTGIDFPF